MLTKTVTAWAALIGLMWPGSAAAFLCETAISDGCHERVTAGALLATGWPGGQTVPDSTHTDRVLVDNLLFNPPPEQRDPWTVAALIGVRHTDFGGNRPTSPDLLAAIHNNTQGQASHCLRAPEDDGVAGDAATAIACKAYILSEVQAAVGDGDVIDLTATVNVSVALKYEFATVSLSRFAFHIGHALHALQDSFTHTYRHPDNPKVVLSFFNYVEPAFKSGYDADRDGQPHHGDFDTCAPGQNLFRVQHATIASAELLTAAGGSDTRTERLAAVSQILDAWLTPSAEPCDQANGYCGVIDADGTLHEALVVTEPEAAGCHGAAPAPSRWAWLAVVWLSWAFWRRRVRGGTT